MIYQNDQLEEAEINIFGEKKFRRQKIVLVKFWSNLNNSIGKKFGFRFFVTLPNVLIFPNKEDPQKQFFSISDILVINLLELITTYTALSS